MTLDDLPFGEPLTPPNPAATPRNADAAGIAALRNALPLLAETLEAAAVMLGHHDDLVSLVGAPPLDCSEATTLRAAIERCREEGLL